MVTLQMHAKMVDRSKTRSQSDGEVLWLERDFDGHV